MKTPIIVKIKNKSSEIWYIDIEEGDNLDEKVKSILPKTLAFDQLIGFVCFCESCQHTFLLQMAYLAGQIGEFIDATSLDVVRQFIVDANPNSMIAEQRPCHLLTIDMLLSCRSVLQKIPENIVIKD